MDETKVQELENAAEEPVIPEEVTEATAPADESPEKRIAELESEVLRGEIKIALLLDGVLAERLDEAARLAEGLVAAGKTPQEAAREVTENYPHFLASRRELPTISAGSYGTADGFSAIRKIFSAR